MDSLEDARYERWFFGQCQWAAFGRRQMEQTIELLRKVHRQKQEGRLAPNAPGIGTAKKFTWEQTAARLVGALR